MEEPIAVGGGGEGIEAGIEDGDFAKRIIPIPFQHAARAVSQSAKKGVRQQFLTNFSHVGDQGFCGRCGWWILSRIVDRPPFFLFLLSILIHQTPAQRTCPAPP